MSSQLNPVKPVRVKLSKSIKHPNALPIAAAIVFINLHTNHHYIQKIP
jgi:hypothetical protein